MHQHAPTWAAQPHLSLKAFSGPFLSLEERHGSGGRPSFQRTFASGNEPRFGSKSAAETREDDFDTEGFIRLVSRPLLGVTLRGYPAPCGSALFCFDCVALRVTVSICDGPSANAELGTWEPGPLARLRQV
jgi:hypothetical protein